MNSKATRRATERGGRVSLSIEDAKIAMKALEDLSYDEYPEDKEVQKTIREMRRVRNTIHERILWRGGRESDTSGEASPTRVASPPQRCPHCGGVKRREDQIYCYKCDRALFGGLPMYRGKAGHR